MMLLSPVPFFPTYPMEPVHTLRMQQLEERQPGQGPQ